MSKWKKWKKWKKQQKKAWNRQLDLQGEQGELGFESLFGLSPAPAASGSDSSTYVSVPYTPPPKWISAGGVVLRDLTADGLDYIYIVKPSNNYGDWTFPKGRVDKDDSLEKTALREVLEEAGIQARLLPNGYLGSGEGLTSITHYYMMVRSGGNPWAHDFETEQVCCISFAEAVKYFEDRNKTREIATLAKAREYIDALRIRLGYSN